jgi:hypothetical protein
MISFTNAVKRPLSLLHSSSRIDPQRAELGEAARIGKTFY